MRRLLKSQKKKHREKNETAVSDVFQAEDTVSPTESCSSSVQGKVPDTYQEDVSITESGDAAEDGDDNDQLESADVPKKSAENGVAALSIVAASPHQDSCKSFGTNLELPALHRDGADSEKNDTKRKGGYASTVAKALKHVASPRAGGKSRKSSTDVSVEINNTAPLHEYQKLLRDYDELSQLLAAQTFTVEQLRRAREDDRAEFLLEQEKLKSQLDEELKFRETLEFKNAQLTALKSDKDMELKLHPFTPHASVAIQTEEIKANLKVEKCCAVDVPGYFSEDNSTQEKKLAILEQENHLLAARLATFLDAGKHESAEELKTVSYELSRTNLMIHFQSFFDSESQECVNALSDVEELDALKKRLAMRQYTELAERSAREALARQLAGMQKFQNGQALQYKEELQRFQHRAEVLETELRNVLNERTLLKEVSKSEPKTAFDLEENEQSVLDIAQKKLEAERKECENKRKVLDDERKKLEKEQQKLDEEREKLGNERKMLKDEQELFNGERERFDNSRQMLKDEWRSLDNAKKLVEENRREAEIGKREVLKQKEEIEVKAKVIAEEGLRLKSEDDCLRSAQQDLVTEKLRVATEAASLDAERRDNRKKELQIEQLESVNRLQGKRIVEECEKLRLLDEDRGRLQKNVESLTEEISVLRERLKKSAETNKSTGSKAETKMASTEAGLKAARMEILSLSKKLQSAEAEMRSTNKYISAENMRLKTHKQDVEAMKRQYEGQLELLQQKLIASEREVQCCRNSHASFKKANEDVSKKWKEDLERWEAKAEALSAELNSCRQTLSNRKPYVEKGVQCSIELSDEGAAQSNVNSNPSSVADVRKSQLEGGLSSTSDRLSWAAVIARKNSSIEKARPKSNGFLKQSHAIKALVSKQKCVKKSILRQRLPVSASTATSPPTAEQPLCMTNNDSDIGGCDAGQAKVLHNVLVVGSGVPKHFTLNRFETVVERKNVEILCFLKERLYDCLFGEVICLSEPLFSESDQDRAKCSNDSFKSQVLFQKEAIARLELSLTLIQDIWRSLRAYDPDLCKKEVESLAPDMWLRMYIQAKTPASSLSTSKSKPSDTQHLTYTQATEELRSLRALERESHKVSAERLKRNVENLSQKLEAAKQDNERLSRELSQRTLRWPTPSEKQTVLPSSVAANQQEMYPSRRRTLQQRDFPQRLVTDVVSTGLYYSHSSNQGLSQQPVTDTTPPRRVFFQTDTCSNGRSEARRAK